MSVTSNKPHLAWSAHSSRASEVAALEKTLLIQTLLKVLGGGAIN